MLYISIRESDSCVAHIRGSIVCIIWVDVMVQCSKNKEDAIHDLIETYGLDYMKNTMDVTSLLSVQ